MHEVTTSRRDAMRSLAILPALIAMPATVSAASPAMAITAIPSPDPVAGYWLAWHGINDGTVSQDAFAQAMDALDYWEPTTQRDFIRKFVTMFHDLDAPPPDDRVALMLAQGNRLVQEGMPC